jgi:non-specific serine/threonine protein kinase
MPSASLHPTDAASAGRPLPAGLAPGSRRIGRYELHRLLGKNSRSMLWLAHADDGREVLLNLPRQQPADAAGLRAWLQGARDASRLNHPQLVPIAEVAIEERWPFIACPRSAGITLDEHLAANPAPSPAQSAQWLCDLLHGLAFAHEAGLSHGDIGGASVLIDAQGRALLMSVGAGVGVAAGEPEDANALPSVGSTGSLRNQRAGQERDLLACGLLLHRLLVGRPALDEPDAPTAVQRLEREIVRLGWSTPQPVSDALRAICNRATASEPRSRYLGARSLERALQGWLDAQAGSEGVLSLLLDRLSSVGHLPALPGLLSRVSAVVALEQQRLAEMVELIVQDPALAFELLRQVNTAHLAASSGGHGFDAVATVRRAVQLIGVQGLRRAAAGLRAWPGPLGSAHADALATSLHQALLAAHVARELCPADMDGEAVFLTALLQHLGGLLLRYHFPDEAEQIARLVEPGEGARGMPAAAAACAVIGVDLDTLAVAVARHWGLDEHVLASLRRASTETPVRVPDDRRDMVRLLGSAAAEAVAAAAGPPAQAAAALARVTQRYARALVLAPGELGDALRQARQAVGAPLRTAASAP